MKTLIVWACAGIALAVSAAASAQPAQGGASAAASAIVEAVQSPAWIERDGKTIPVAPGMRLEDHDQVRTGGNSRILLRMPEGSTVKLGENARYRIDVQQRKGNLYTAAMNVFEGAFRFTTNVLAQYRGKRDVRIQFPTVTAGIRGTDVWGKSASDREIVCLIEGQVEVERGQDKPITLDQPMLFYIAPKGQAALPVAPVPPEQLKEWSAETEIQAGRGASRRGGRWNVMLASVESQSDALNVYDAVRAAGYPAEIRPRLADGKRLYDVQLRQLPSRAEAQALADAVQGKYGVSEAKVSG